MTDKPTKQDQTITPAGEVELNEEELNQVTGGGIIDKLQTNDYTENDSGSSKIPVGYLKKPSGWKVDK